MPSAVRVIDRIQDQGDFQGPLTDGQFLKWDATAGKFLLAGSVGGDSTYVHTQSVAAMVWTVSHNLGKKPSVTVVDSGENVVVGDVAYLDTNSLTVTFSVAFGGKAFCN